MLLMASTLTDPCIICRIDAFFAAKAKNLASVQRRGRAVFMASWILTEF